MKRVAQDSSLVGRRRRAAARAVRVLRYLRRLGVSAVVVGSLAEGRFGESSDVDFLILECPPHLRYRLECPPHLRYRIEAAIEDRMLDIPFDAVYRDEARAALVQRMEAVAKGEREVIRIAA